VGAIIEGEIRNITEFGLFVGLDHEIDGMVHLSDLDWTLTGEEVQASVDAVVAALRARGWDIRGE